MFKNRCDILRHWPPNTSVPTWSLWGFGDSSMQSSLQSPVEIIPCYVERQQGKVQLQLSSGTSEAVFVKWHVTSTPTDLNRNSTASLAVCESAHVHWVLGWLGFKEQMLPYLLNWNICPFGSKLTAFKWPPKSSHTWGNYFGVTKHAHSY